MPDAAFKLTPEDIELLRQAEAKQHYTVAPTRYEPCLCGKLLDVLQWERKWHSGRFSKGAQVAPGVNYTDLICADCRKEFNSWPRIVCLGCRRLMGFYKPGRQSTGFVFENDRHYHIADCPRCNPAAKSTAVIEHDRFCLEQGVRVVVPSDLIQEIEQKRLQADKAAATLREEYESSQRTV